MRTRREQKARRHRRIKKTVQGSGDRPRLVVFRSLQHIYAQLIDDGARKTLVSASTLDKEFRGRANGTANVEAAREVGKLVGQRAAAAGHKKAVFDRGGHPYYGRVKALAEGAREAGLEF